MMLDIEELRWCSSFLEADFKFEKYTLYYSTLPFLNFLAISFLLSDAYLLMPLELAQPTIWCYMDAKGR